MICFRRTLQELEEAMVHIERQLSLLLRVHDRQGATRYYSAGKHSGQRGAGSTQTALLRAVRRWL